MAEFKVVVADPETGETFQREVDGQDANRFLGRELGDEIGGDAVGLSDHTIELTGGSDETGRPMREDVSGTRLKELLLEGGVGFEPSREGERKRITVRGREIDDDIAQINASVVDGDGDVAAALGVSQGDLIRVAIDREEYHARVASDSTGRFLRGAFDNRRLAREAGEGANRLVEWLDANGREPGDSVVLDVVVPGELYGLRVPGERTVYDANRGPRSSLADIAQDVDE